ncbi:carboxyltransferase domain-containing protein, partial [Bacillus spizizenii]|uniref:carboxyltransferase domain-containing protein n=1 Tax=Bacillus spizizenii TaxID=96241 RepID=UPI001F623D44
LPPGISTPIEQVKRDVEERLKEISTDYENNRRIVEIPVCYGGEFGPDLDEVAKINQLSQEEVIDIHTHGEYVVYMLGFAPG